MPNEKRGQAALFDALTTKGTAFSEAERRNYGLLGLLPTAVKTLEDQAAHCWHEFSTRHDDLDKQITAAEKGGATVDDLALEKLKKERLHLKDTLYRMVNQGG